MTRPNDLVTLFNGRIVITGRNWAPVQWTIILFITATGLFFAFPAVYLLNQYEPKANRSAAPLALGILLCISCVYFYVRTLVTDPGIIVRNPSIKRTATNRPPRRQMVNGSKGGRVMIKYCDTCEIFQPPKTEHCVTCNNCCQHYDHHCPWIGSCIGVRNYRYFYSFVLCMCMYEVVIMVSCVVQIVNMASLSMVGVDYVGPSLLLLLAAGWSVFTFALCGLHSYLIVFDKTTNEVLVQKRESDKLTKRSTLRQNCTRISRVLLGIDTPPSYVRIKWNNDEKKSREEGGKQVKEEADLIETIGVDEFVGLVKAPFFNNENENPLQQNPIEEAIITTTSTESFANHHGVEEKKITTDEEALNIV